MGESLDSVSVALWFAHGVVLVLWLVRQAKRNAAVWLRFGVV
ncbi:hypothetical protein ACOLXF_003056 [Vibrio fluvialis]